MRILTPLLCALFALADLPAVRTAVLGTEGCPAAVSGPALPAWMALLGAYLEENRLGRLAWARPMAMGAVAAVLTLGFLLPPSWAAASWLAPTYVTVEELPTAFKQDYPISSDQEKSAHY